VAPAVEQLLAREAPGKGRVIAHDIDSLRRQVLLDLPDFDSHFADHVAIVRRMLRSMVYPVWITSVEKYADRAQQELLQQVAEGNHAANFVFVLNKVDLVAAEAGQRVGWAPPTKNAGEEVGSGQSAVGRQPAAG